MNTTNKFFEKEVTKEKRILNEQEPEHQKPEGTTLNRLKLDTSVNTNLLDVVRQRKLEAEIQTYWPESFGY